LAFPKVSEVGVTRVHAPLAPELRFPLHQLGESGSGRYPRGNRVEVHDWKPASREQSGKGVATYKKERAKRARAHEAAAATSTNGVRVETMNNVDYPRQRTPIHMGRRVSLGAMAMGL